MDIFGRSPQEEIDNMLLLPVSTEQYLQSHKIRKNAFIITIISDNKIQSPDDYFEEYDIDKAP